MKGFVLGLIMIALIVVAFDVTDFQAGVIAVVVITIVPPIVRLGEDQDG